ncbi:retrovirus-related Pol polyprotein from transposon TNT 1-94, partial [Trifolium medium]|nr:retrovirus-related Pol polyprotein from transposon TNT 1-94 [Trifolium medium]
THIEPHIVKQASDNPNWLQAMQSEYSALMTNNTWSLVPLPAHRRAIGCKWVFRIKIILTLALSFQWDIQQIDVSNAFLNGILQEEVYMTQPPGFVQGDKTLVCKLQRALYGLKQAPRAWYERLTHALVSFGFHSSRCHPSLFVYNHNGVTLYVLVYVDDILLTGSSSAILHDLIGKLNAQFALKHLGKPDYFLGIEVKYLSTGSVLLTQSKYIKDLLHKANMAEAKGICTPMFVSTFARPLHTHWQAVKRILGYLLHTSHHGLLLQPSATVSKFSIRAYSDSDWASDMDDRRSTSGSCIFFGPNLVSWSAKKQSLVARSSAEAEYRALAHTTSELMWIQSLLLDLKIPIHTPALLCDNVSAVLIAHNPVLHARTKHLELDIHFVREKVVAKALHIQHVPGSDQIADALTKPLPTSRFLALRDKLKISAKYASKSDRELDIVTEAYDQWLVQDQMLFTWLLSTLAESVLPRTIGCRHSFQVWEQIHKYFHALLKAKVRQLRSELKTIKKGTEPITKFVLRIWKDFCLFKNLDKFRQELTVPNASANLAHSHGVRGNTGPRGRGRSNRGQGRAPGNSAGTRPTCQLCNKYGHHVMDCWYRFDENFVPANHAAVPKPGPKGPQDPKDPEPQACTANFASSTQELVIPQSWFPDFGASHHITADGNNLAQGKSYHGYNKVHMGNGVGLNIASIGKASFPSPLHPSKTFKLTELLHVDNQILLKESLGADGLYSFPHLSLLKGPMCLTNLASQSLFQSAKDHLANIVYTNPFELVHTDLWGPAHIPSNCGYSYYIAFVDACTKYTWLSISTLLTTLGIQHRVTCPHTSHQNGTVERRHRSIVETGLTLLAHANMPLELWDHSFTTVVYILNRLPTTALTNFSSPYHALYHKIPDYHSIKVFGCSCFPHLRPYLSHKLNFRSTKCVFLASNKTHHWSTVIPILSSQLQPSLPTNIESSPPAPVMEQSSPSPHVGPLVEASPVGDASSHPTNDMTVSDGSFHHTNDRVASDSLSPHTLDMSASDSLSPIIPPVSVKRLPAPKLPVPKSTNDHPMVTRGKIGNLKPKVFLAH